MGRWYDVVWVRIPDVDPALDTVGPSAESTKQHAAPSSTRAQGLALGSAAFARTEGIAYGNGSVDFCCTTGGPAKLGQVFRLDPRRERLSLGVDPDDHALPDGPDNIVIAPFGDLVVREGDLGQRENFGVGVTSSGRCYRLARNAHPAKREFAGACFSPDGRTMFVNVQRPGMTFAVWGPWDRRLT